jgi:hypothetical protein
MPTPSRIVSFADNWKAFDELAQRIALEATVGVRDVFVSDGIDAHVALEAASGQRGQASIGRLRQHRGQLREVLGDDVKVIEQPFGCVGDGAIALHGGRQRAIGVRECGPGSRPRVRAGRSSD